MCFVIDEMRLSGMNPDGIIIGVCAFMIIGLFHPLVISTEYHLGKKAWPLFLLMGLAGLFYSAFASSEIYSAVAGVFGFTSLWSIRELFEQEKRVKNGWFPKKSDEERT